MRKWLFLSNFLFLQAMHDASSKQNNRGLTEALLIGWVGVYLIGLVCSKAILSVGIVGLALTAIAYGWRTSWGASDSYRRVKPFLFPVIIFLLTLLSGINSDNLHVWSQFVAKKAPFLVLPFAFFMARNHFAKRFYDYLLGFVIIVGVVALGVIGNYILNFDDLNQAIGKGQSITTPIDHAEFSIYIAFAAICSLFMYLEDKRVIRLASQTTLLLTAIFLTIVLHILAVRSGLAVFYSVLLFVGGYHFYSTQRYKLLLGFMVGIFLFPMIAIKTIPSLNKKMSYAKWDINQYKKGQGLNYSDSERIFSLQAGWAIFQSSPLIGVGIGDLKEKCQEAYAARQYPELQHYPHNQYLFTLAAMGILGFLLYSIALLGPLWFTKGIYNPYFISLHAVLFISALVENTLERTFSIGFYLFFVLLSLCHLTNKWDQQK